MNTHSHALTLTHMLTDIALMCTHTCTCTLTHAHLHSHMHTHSHIGSHMDPCTYMHVPQAFTIQYNFMAAFRHMACVLYKESVCNTLKVGKKI